MQIQILSRAILKADVETIQVQRFHMKISGFLSLCTISLCGLVKNISVSNIQGVT